jgi:hypothetical protein
MFGIKMQHCSCDVVPVSTLRIGVEQAQIRDDVLFVVNGLYGIGGSGIGDIGIRRRAAYDMARDRGRSTKAWLSAALIFGPFALLALLILGKRNSEAGRTAP